MSDLREITARLARDAAILADACAPAGDPEGAMDRGQQEIDEAVGGVRQALRDLAWYRAEQAGQFSLPI
jgi:hypothetical protein